ncbi:MAG: TIGR03986 family CRISPR-associated RAMP protein [Nitrospinae bacterium]|nr:TIGR03986 family CRISPR-associated RAMP protein [Nitrospinota bacterium]
MNPYNFVKVDSFTPRYGYKGHNIFEGHRGYITVEMKLMTPLFIGGKREEIPLNNGDKHYKVEFFSVNEKPCIPSTSLKGMLRSTIETLSNSCFLADYSENEKMNYLGYRLDVSNRNLSREIQGLKPGILKRRDNEWYFIPLSEAKILTTADRRNDERKLFVATGKGIPEKLSTEDGAMRYNNSKRNRCQIDLVSDIYASRFKIDSVNNINISPTSTNKTFSYMNLEQPINIRLFGIIRKLKELRKSSNNRKFPVELYKLKEISDRKEILEKKLSVYKSNIANEKRQKQSDRNLVKIEILDYQLSEVYIKTSYDIETKTQDRVFFKFGEEDLSGYILQQEGIKVDDTIIRKFKNAVAARYDEFDKHYEHDYLFKLQPEKVKDSMLVYAKFNEANNIEYLTYTRVPRKPYEYGVSDIVNRIGKNPCNNLNSLCPACNIFGFVKGKNSLAGKISVSMGVITENKGFHDPVPIKTLSSPKPTFCQFYLINNRKHNGKSTRPHLTYDNSNAEIGRKEYLNHSPEYLDYEDPSGEQTKFNSTIKPLKEGSKFKFKIYFQNLNNYEFGSLLYALNMKYNNQRVGFKLGMGKPLGLGSVEVENLEVKKADINKKYQSLFSEYESTLSEDEIKGLINIYKMIQSTSNPEQFKSEFISLNNKLDPKRYKDEDTSKFYDVGYIKGLHILRLINRNGTIYTVKYPTRMRDGELVGFQWFIDEKDDPAQRLFQPDDTANITLKD